MPFLQSISNFFSGNPPNPSSSRMANRKSVMNSTLDAFALPTTHGENGMRYPGNYADGGLPQADSASSSPGPSRRGSNAYGVYPPAKETYPGASASPNYYPPPSHTFHRLRNTLANSFPELLETLNGPANPHMLAAFEAELGCTLPRAVRESLLVVDGQDLEATGNIAGSGGLFYGLHFLPLEEIMREWAFWRQAEHDPKAGNNAAVLATMASVPPNWIKKLYACRGWMPLLSDRTGNYVGVDLDPGASGTWGQVIVFGRDFDRKCVLWRGDGEGGWGKWLASFVEELESGEGWEADKATVSDEEEDVGYGSYNGGGSFGESGQGLRLAGEYRGRNVLEAWWDRSVRKWETLGLGLDVEEVEKGMDEARRLAGYESEPHSDGKGKGKARLEGLGIAMRAGESAAQGEMAGMGSPHIPAAPGTPVPRDSDVLLPPASPDQPPIPKIRQPKPSPVRVITPIASTADHPLKATISPSGYLSPPSRSPPRTRRRDPAPAPTPIDLPTRADVQAMSAIAQAERSGLRGGWVMNLDTSAGAANRRASRVDPEADMVDIDLEGGKIERFGSPRMSDAEMERQREEEKLALAGLEHRRSPVLIQPGRVPSPLSRESSFDEGLSEKTPRAASRVGDGMITVPPSVIAATTAIRRPPPAANHSDLSIRTFTSAEEERDRPVIRGGTRSAPLARSERELSIISTDSQDGLLESRTNRSMSPVSGSFMSGDVAHSPTALNMSRANSESGDNDSRLASPLVDVPRKGLAAFKRDRGLEDELEEISLDAPASAPPAT